MPSNVAENSQRRLVQPPILIVVAIVLLSAGLIFFSAVASRWSAARNSRTWVATDGVIIESRLPSNCTYCRPVINYRYVIEGQSFVGDSLVAGPQDYYRASEAQGEVSRYPVGRKVNVFANPGNPAMAALEPGSFRGTIYLFISAGLVFCGSALILFWQTYHRSARN